MSDIKQAMLDEIDTIDKWGEAINGLGMQILSYGQYIHINEVAEVINKHLEGMVIVSAEPTEEMLDRGYDISDAGAELRDVYKFMIGTLEASK